MAAGSASPLDFNPICLIRRGFFANKPFNIKNKLRTIVVEMFVMKIF